ncbi:MAG: hypothetical protein ABI871_08240 [Chthoniobacterales bacterium]
MASLPRSDALTDQSQSVSLAAMSLIRGLFWILLFAFFTFCFVVLFEYGTHDFANGFQKEFERVKAFAQQAAHPSKSDKNDKARK